MLDWTDLIEWINVITLKGRHILVSNGSVPLSSNYDGICTDVPIGDSMSIVIDDLDAFELLANDSKSARRVMSTIQSSLSKVCGLVPLFTVDPVRFDRDEYRFIIMTIFVDQ
jgi:hypothetical protein